MEAISNEEAPNSREVAAKISDSILISCTLFCLGLYRHVPAPTLMDLAGQVDENLYSLTLLFTIRSLGYIFGLFTGTLAYRHFRNMSPLLHFIFMFLMAISAYTVSLCTTFKALSLSFCAAGVCAAAIEAGVNTREIGATIQFNRVLYLTAGFFQGVGSLAAPLISRWFIRENMERINFPKLIDKTENMTADSNTITEPVTSVPFIYTTLSIIMVILSLLWVARYFLHQDKNSLPKKVKIEDKAQIYRKSAMFHSSLFCFFATSIDFGYAQILPVLTVVQFKRNPREGCDLLILFLSFAALGRLAAVFISKTQIVGFVGFFAQAVAMIFCGGIFVRVFHDEGMFWITNAIVGFAAGPLFPCSVAWLCISLHVTHQDVIPLILLAALAEMIAPLLLGYVLWHQPELLGNYLLALAIILSIILAFNSFVLYTFEKKMEQLIKKPSISLTAEMTWPSVQRTQPETEDSVDVPSINDRLEKIHERLVFENQSFQGFFRGLEVPMARLEDKSNSAEKEEEEDKAENLTSGIWVAGGIMRRMLKPSKNNQ